LIVIKNLEKKSEAYFYSILETSIGKFRVYLYTGKILKINLTTKEVNTDDLNQSWVEKYIGGKGLGFRYLFSEMDPTRKPLSPSNVLIFMTGPVGGSILPSSSRVSVITKSPATQTILDSNMGGNLGAEIKYAGYDGIIITGRSEKPVYVTINDDSVVVNDARDLWGKGIFEVENNIRRILDDEQYKIAAIGPAGENLVHFACITSECYRHGGRGGAGAVMGSKNLKAIAVKGSNGVKVHDMKSFLDLAMKMQWEAVSEENDPSRSNIWVIRDGSPYLVDSVNEMGILPVRNFQEGQWKRIEKIDSEAVKGKKKGDRACFSCPLACGKFTQVNGNMVEGPEFETLSVAGSNCGIDDIGAIIRFNESCDNLGLDTISTGNVIAFAMEMTERKIHDFGIRFGDRENYVQIPEEIAYLKSRGEDLGLGVRALAAKYGGREFAMEVKGLEFPGYEPRGNYGMGLAYATSERGACHLRAYTVYHPDPFDLQAMTKEVISHQHRLSVKNSLIFCFFLHSININEMAQILNIAMGTDSYKEEGLWEAGERIWNLGRLFNIKAGLTVKDDCLPPRVFNEGLLNGPNRNRVLSKEDFRTMLRSYYRERGWDDNGVPERKTLGKLKVDIG
jgi:aldehyde:ferredoxin oxidoreductase